VATHLSDVLTSDTNDWFCIWVTAPTMHCIIQLFNKHRHQC